MTEAEKVELYVHIKDLLKEKKQIDKYLNDTVLLKYIARENASTILKSRLKEIEEKLEKMNYECKYENEQFVTKAYGEEIAIQTLHKLIVGGLEFPVDLTLGGM